MAASSPLGPTGTRSVVVIDEGDVRAAATKAQVRMDVRAVEMGLLCFA